jgi:aspartyl-tRNA(Asn)/glutamyl-tRNA(Gln) amidotransferase subunit B
LGLINKESVAWDDVRITPAHFAALVRMAETRAVSSRGAKNILAAMLTNPAHPETIATEEGLLQVSDAAALEPAARDIIAGNPKAVADYQAGKTEALQFMIGKAMSALKGKGNPATLKEIFERLLA